MKRLNWPMVWRAPCTALVLAAAAGLASAQTDPAQLTGTLKKVRESGSITIGHRESSIPFSSLSARGEPIGYSIDLWPAISSPRTRPICRTIAGI